MKSALDCIPCFAGQALSVARLASHEPRVQERILREALRRASEADLTQTPARIGRDIQREVRELTGQEDPYLTVKEASSFPKARRTSNRSMAASKTFFSFSRSSVLSWPGILTGPSGAWSCTATFPGWRAVPPPGLQVSRGKQI